MQFLQRTVRQGKNTINKPSFQRNLNRANIRSLKNCWHSEIPLIIVGGQYLAEKRKEKKPTLTHDKVSQVRAIHVYFALTVLMLHCVNKITLRCLVIQWIGFHTLATPTSRRTATSGRLASPTYGQHLQVMNPGRRGTSSGDAGKVNKRRLGTVRTECFYKIKKARNGLTLHKSICAMYVCSASKALLDVILDLRRHARVHILTFTF